MAATDQKYDVVVADLFHPSRDGAGSLYTLEHFKSIRNILTENGLFCQWLPLYQMDLEMFKTITRTFLKVFPDGQAFLAHYSIDLPIIGLIGENNQLRFPEKWYDKRMHGKAFQRHMAGFGFDSIYSLLGTFLAGGETLLKFTGDGPINTDELFPYDRDASYKLLRDLERANPLKPEAGILRQRPFVFSDS